MADPVRTILLADAVTTAATTASRRTNIGNPRALILTWDITSAERDTGNETYDLYVIGGDGTSEWDLAHFPQVASTGAKRFTAVVQGLLLPQQVTTAAPGVASNESATLATVTGSANAIRSLNVGVVRHGAIGPLIGYDIVVAGTIATGIVYSLKVTAVY